jgi:hypothetical protein
MVPLVCRMTHGLFLNRACEEARLFDRLKSVSWRGDYIGSDDGWIAAWAREVN